MTTESLTANQRVAHNMRHLRILRGLGQAELGERLEALTGKPWSRATVSLAETSVHGKRVRIFDADLIVAIATVFDVSPADLLSIPSDDSLVTKAADLGEVAARFERAGRLLVDGMEKALEVLR